METGREREKKLRNRSMGVGGGGGVKDRKERRRKGKCLLAMMDWILWPKYFTVNHRWKAINGIRVGRNCTETYPHSTWVSLVICKYI